MLSIPGVTCFLSEKLSQDPLEKFFASKHQRGGACENPNVAEFRANTQALCVVDTVCATVTKGNCRGNIELEKNQEDKEKTTAAPQMTQKAQLIVVCLCNFC